ncbi:MAG: hypothetical protein DRP81_06040 [Candidatus Omnitrophota bacterium]|nr:MAG: hypothetical protein DRP81_06040 [Candidatus Omnitrophota bacterium]
MLKAEIIIERYDKKGQLLEKIKQKSRSFLKQFIQLIEVQTNQTNKTITDITGTDRTVNNEDINLFCTPGSGTEYTDPTQRNVQGENIGIVVGSGTTAVTPTDTKLQTKIAHGTGSGQLIHLGCGFKPVVISGSDAYVDLVRFFENQSGGDVTINEVGIYAIGASQQYGFCICRDVLSSSITVADGQLLKVRYRIKVTAS